jgi:nucleolar protein 14
LAELGQTIHYRPLGMAKGSQLSQLKSALSQAGISKTQNGKKRKRSHSIDQDKIKKAAKLQEIHKKLNPFDVKVTKLKHDVGGRKIKGSKGQPAQSKQAGIQQVRIFYFLGISTGLLHCL